MPRHPNLWRWLAILAGVAVIVGHNRAMQPWTLDDAYISFRYAENLVRGQGLVFNEGERVEGYTNFLWTVLVAGGYAAGLPSPVAAKALGGIFSAALLGILAFSDRIVPTLDARVSALATALVMTCGVTTRWSLSGMEVPLVTLLATAAFLVHLRARARPAETHLDLLAGALCGLVMMCRPDAGLVFGGLWLDRVAQLRKDRAGLRPLVRLTAAFLVTFAPFWAWRFSYYGYPLPNTFYVKVGSTLDQLIRGYWYLADFAEVGLPMLLAAGVGALYLRRMPALPGAGALVAFVLMQLAYIFAVGGDVFWGHRFFAIVMPPVGLMTARLIVHVIPTVAGRAAAIAALLALNLVNVALHTDLNHRGVVSAQGLEVGEFLRDNAPPDAVLATNIAGSIPWASGLRTIDTLGLNDVHIAHRQMPHMGKGRAGHEKGDGDYVLSKEPDYVLFASSRGSRRPKFVGDRELYRNDEFHEAYALRVYELESGLRLWLYVRRQSQGGKDLEATPFMVGVNPFTEGRMSYPDGQLEEDEDDARE